MEQKAWWKFMIVTDKPDFNCFEYKSLKLPWILVLICWKFEYKQSLILNGSRLIQLYSSHSVACTSSHFTEGHRQRLLWLHTPKYIFFLNLIIWTWGRALVTPQSSWPLWLIRVTQPDNYWLGMPNWSRVTWLTQDYHVVSVGLRPGRVPGLKLLDWTWTRKGQAPPSVARLLVCRKITTIFSLVQLWQPELSVW